MQMVVKILRDCTATAVSDLSSLLCTTDVLVVDVPTLVLVVFVGIP